MNGLDQLQPVEGMGPVGEIRLVPDLETFRVLPYAPRTGALLVDHVTLDGEPAPQCPRSFLKRMEARLAERDGARLEVAFENEFALAVRDGRRLRAGRREPVLLDDRHDDVAGVRRRARRRARAAGHSARAVLRRARSRPAGDLDPARTCAASGGRADPRARDDPRRRCAARPRRVARAEAVARRRRQRRPHPLLALGTASATASTTRRADDRLSAEARAFLAGVLEHLPGALRPDGAELQLVPPHRPAVLGGRVHVLGSRQPRGADPRAVGVRRHGGGVDERRAEGRGLERQSVPRARRADRRRARRARARARAAGAGRGRSGDDRGGRARAGAASCACRRRRRRRSTRSRPTRCSSTRSGRCSRRPTSPSAARSGTLTPAGDETFEQQGHFSKY